MKLKLKKGVILGCVIMLMGIFASESCLAKDVYARKRRIDGWAGTLIGVEHTYVCTQGGQAQERCYSRTGGSANGSKISETKHNDNGIAKCVYENGGPGNPAGLCHVNNDQYSYLDWRRNGACHQESNLMLRNPGGDAPTIVNWSANGGNGGTDTWLRFGAYGRLGLPENCKKVCP